MYKSKSAKIGMILGTANSFEKNISFGLELELGVLIEE
jgi:hypothetical protein